MLVFVFLFLCTRVFILSVVVSLVVSGCKHSCQSVDVQINVSGYTRLDACAGVDELVVTS